MSKFIIISPWILKSYVSVIVVFTNFTKHSMSGIQIVEIWSWEALGLAEMSLGSGR
jgi:hypothetical protein